MGFNSGFKGLMATLTFWLLPNHGVSVVISSNDQTPLRAAAANVHLEVPRQLLSNGGSVRIPRKRDSIALLEAADSDQLEAFREFLKHRACVVIAMTNVL